jgi:membrane protein
MFREQTEEERMAEQRRRERKEITGGLIVIALSAAYLFWIRRILKSKTAKSVPREIFRDAATVAGLLLALALLSEMVYGSSGFRAGHFRSAMFIAVSSAVLPYLCMMYLADGYRRPYLWRAKILYPQTAAILAYWFMLYAANIADGEGSGNVMASLFGLLLSTAFCIALKTKFSTKEN